MGEGLIYNGFFGFKVEPFGVTPDPRFLYLSRIHEEAFASIRYGINERRGFVMLTGEIGSGKTTLIRHIVDSLDDKTHTSIILNPKAEALELLKLIIQDFGIVTTASTYQELMESLNSFLLDCYRKGELAALIIDEAQETSPECLEFVRLLSNLETDTNKLLQVVLIGQPELRQIVSSDRLKQLDQRIAVRYHLGNLDREEIPKYISHRMKIAGNLVSFEQNAVSLIYKKSRGVPRLVNLICDRSLLLAFSENRLGVTKKHVKSALKELEGPMEPRPNRLIHAVWAVFGLILALGLAVLFFSTQATNKITPPPIAEKTIANIPNEPVKPATPEIPIIYLEDGVYYTKSTELAEKASLLNLLNLWGVQIKDPDNPVPEIKKIGLTLFEFNDSAKLMKFRTSAVIKYKNRGGDGFALLRWVVGDNAMIIDPVEGKKILPFSEVLPNVTQIKILYKASKSGNQKKDAESMIIDSLKTDGPRLSP